jgi:exonuclease III
MKCINWNLEWATPASKRGKAISQIIGDISADVGCFTEVFPEMFMQSGYTISSQSDYGYQNTGKKRKVILWSSTPWEHIDTVGSSRLPSGRFVSGISKGIRYIGVCIPWKDAHVRTGNKDRKTWEELLCYIEALNEIIPKYLKTGDKICLLGDFNQRIPRFRQPIEVFDKLISTLKNDFRLITEGLNDEEKKPLIDHIAVSESIKGEFSKIIPKNHRESFKLSDHSGVVADIT